MEELKQLIKEDKELIRTLDAHLLAFKDAVADLSSTISLFTQFFERQDRFMQTMLDFISKGKV